MNNEQLITVEKFNCLLKNLIDNNCGDFLLQIGDNDIHMDDIGIDYVNHKIKINGMLYRLKDLNAVSNLRSKIDKAYEEFYIERTKD